MVSTLTKAHAILADAISASPDSHALPGGNAMQLLLNGTMYFGLGACLLAFVIGGGAFALGRHGGNIRHAENGRTAMVAGGVGAFLVGAAATLINFFFNTGQGVK